MLTDAVFVGICNKELAITGCANPFQQLMHTPGIEFFKHIIQ